MSELDIAKTLQYDQRMAERHIQFGHNISTVVKLLQDRVDRLSIVSSGVNTEDRAELDGEYRFTIKWLAPLDGSRLALYADTANYGDVDSTVICANDSGHPFSMYHRHGFPKRRRAWSGHSVLELGKTLDHILTHARGVVHLMSKQSTRQESAND